MDIFSTCASLVQPIDQYIIKPLMRRGSYVFNYRRNVAELRHEVQTLKDDRESLQISVKDAERRGDNIHEKVEKWLDNADKAIEEAEMLVQGEEDANKRRCFVGLCPDLKGRYQLGKRAAEEASTIVKLVHEGNFGPSQISYRPAPQQLVCSSVHGFEGLPSRADILKQVMDAVTDPNVDIVGVSGMGGLGKTTLVNEVHNQATEGKLFDVVALVTLSQKAELKSIQGDIAEVLGLKFKEQNFELRANRLKERLMKEKKVLIILDNLWEEIDLGRLGIPLTEKQRVSSRGEDDHKRCTILLTSRNSHLLTCKMGAQKEFPLALLPEEESLFLLKRKVGDLRVQESLAIDVAKKCAGLPLLLATVAIGLKNKELEVWKDTLKRLSYFDDQEIQEKVHSVLESSYRDLAREEARSFFLLCGLFPHADISILDLLKYSMGLGLLKRIDTVQDARNRVQSLIEELKSSFLLLDSEEDGCVRIHDIVQDVATSIAFRDQLAFKKVGGPLEGGQSADVKCFKRIFLEVSDISEFRLWLQCPDIEFFRLSVQDRSVKIPDDLFEGITKLKVLNFTGMRFSSLPSSLSSVTSLHTLCLDGCRLQDISVIWQLKNLEVLSLRRSDIDELPRDLMQLTRLKMLDLTGCYHLKFIPEDVLSRLSLLEELHMGNSFTSWEVKRRDNKINASLSDLKQLSRLTYLEIDVPDASKLPKELFSERLERFKISIGDGWHWWERYRTSRTLKLKLHTSFHDWGQGVKILLKKVEDLYLDGVKGVKNVLYDLHDEGFPQLKHLFIQNDRDIQYVIDSKVQSTSKAFPVLESLILHELVNLEKICRGQLMAGDFCQLKILRVESCNKLKNLFPFSMIRNLKQLLEMEVMDCSDVEEIFTSETEEEGDKNEVSEFTQLCSLKLQLPLLRRFCSKVKSSPASTSSAHPRQNQSTIDPQCPLFNEMIVFPNLKDLKLCAIAVENIWWDQFGDQASFYNLTSLTVEACSKINSLFTSKMVIRNLGQLQRLEICECKFMEEVIAAEGETICTTSFPKLKFLKLKGLSKLIRFFSGDFMELPSLKELWIENCPALKSFITNPIATTTSRANLALFDKKVAFPNLEELHIEDMSGLKMIWQNEMVIRNLEQLQRLEICKCKLIDRVIPAEGEMISKMLFPKLEFLKLECLSKLVRFCSSDFLELRSLKELWIENCPALKSFISNPIATATSGTNLALFDEKVVFPNLEELHIEDMGGLKMIWQNGLHEGSFCKLKTMIVRRAEKLENVFPSNFLMSRFMNLERLDVTNCELIEEVFDLSSQEQLINFSRLHGIPASQLKQLWISNLPKLKHIWKNDAREREIIFFQKLHDVYVHSCPSLKSIFPATIATHLSELEKLTIISCGIEEIIDRGGVTETIFKFEFPKLTTLHLYGLEELRTLYPGTHTSDWPILEKLDIQDCPKMEIFSWESQSIGGKSWRRQSENPSRQPFFTVEKVIPKLEELKLNNKDAKSILNGNWPDNLFQKVRSLSLQNFDKESASVLFALLGRFPNLESLHVKNRGWRRLDAVTELFSCEGLIDEENQGRTIPRIKHMKLQSLDKLKRFCKQDCQLDRIFESLETLEVWSCDSLISLGPSISIASFGNLSRLDVWFCDGLLNLVTSSTAQCLGLLTELSIRHCSMVNEVVAREEDDREDQITWGNLKSLELYYLSSLTYFCSAYHTFNFPSLEEVIIEQCHEMKSFSGGVSITPRLKKVKLAEYNDKGRWAGDLNTTIQQLCAELVTFDGIGHLKLSEYPQLKEKWHSEELPAKFFSNLWSLSVDECASSSTAIPANLLPFLDNLQQLEVQNCDLVEEVFDLTLPNAADAPIGTLPKLSNLLLIDLPRLKHVWNEEPKGVFDFRNLEELKIHNCGSLRYIFSPTTCFGLLRLRELEVEDCPLIEEIISKEVTTCNVEFPLLSSIYLRRLPNLTSFYPGNGTVQCPSVQKIAIFDCSSAFTFTFLSEPSPNATNRANHAKVNPNLEELTLRGKAAKLILNSSCPDYRFQKVRLLSLENFDKESASVPFALLGRFPNLESLHVKSNWFKELFSCEGLINEENQGRTIPRIKHMKLKYLYRLKRFCKQDCQLDRIFESLETLEVSFCNSLISLGPSINIASFGNLSRLDVSYCKGLLNLVTSSTAQCLGLLTELCISYCSMVNEVVAGGEDDRKDQITWGNLKSLKLCNLSNLTYFCSAYHTFNFPSLKEVIIKQCPKMKAFSGGVSITPKLEKVKLSERNDKERWEGDLNTTIQQLCAELVTFDGIEDLKLSEYPQLKEKWHSEELPAKFFYNLWSLIVDECASSLTAIPSNILSFLDELRELELQNCDLVEDVFDLTVPNAADAPIGTLPKLSKLLLIDLPRLKHVWNEEPKGVFDFKNLEVIKIRNCPTLKYIFSPTTCLGLVQLQELEVKDCPLIKEIISKEATACNVEFFPGQAMELEVKNCTSVEENITSGEEEAVVNTMFSQLNSLVLESLPNLTSFCSLTNVLELQSLEKVTVVDCPRIELFASTILVAQEPNVVTNEGRLGQEGFSTPAVLLFGAKVACRNLKELKVEYNNNTKGLLHGKFPTEYSTKIEVLELTNFPYEETLFPADILLRLPSLEKLVVNDADFGELFLEQRIVDKKNSDEQVTNLRQLKLSKLPKVRQLFQDHSIPDLVIQNLETLKVIECIGLKILMPSSLSFQNLTTLKVSKCHGLTNLMTSSTAKSLEKLTRMSITECDMVEEMVSGEGNVGEDEIAFGQLEDLKLRCLPNLVGFCSGNHTFNFPLLGEVTLIECPKMKFFTKGTVYSPQLTELQISVDEDQWRWEGSLNQTVQTLFSEMGVGNA